MPRRVTLLVQIFLVLGLLVPGGLDAAPAPAATSQARVAAPEARSAAAGDRALVSKRARTRQDRRQDRRQDTQRERGKDRKQAERKQAERKQNDKQKNRQQNRAQVQQQPTELPSGRLPAAESVAPAAGSPPSIEDRYIVVLEEGTGDVTSATTDIAADTEGVVPTHVYENVLEGFAAVIPDDQLAAVQNDPRVESVMPDGIVRAYAQTLPTGVNRIDADLDATANIGSGQQVDVDVAILDTAGADTHEDLNIHHWTNCTDSLVDTDDDGHGTHVGGTIGALDNDIGVVGVAPGARLWNVRVLEEGWGYNRWIICGLDFVTAHATDQGYGDIEVANLSLGGRGSDSDCQTALTDKFHRAFCRTVAAGVTVVVAAGNEMVDASTVTPAAYDEVITVSALADSDGKPGGLGDATRSGVDDSLATFSNFGADVDIAAPGVGILSTVPGGYDRMSGTSMASPHVAGAAALYLANNPGASPAQVKTALLDNRDAIALPNDPDGIDEGVLRVARAASTPPVSEPAPAASNEPAAPTATAIEPAPAVDGSQSPAPAKDKKKKKKGKGKGKKG